MPMPFLTHALTIREIFHKRFQYLIPLYQRPYSWSNKQGDTLLDDVIYNMGDEKDSYLNDAYFMGATIHTGAPEQVVEPNALLDLFTKIVSKEKLPENMRGNFSVVDGKQRFVTLQILFCLLRDMAPANRKAEFDELIGDGSRDNPWRIKMPGDEGDFFIAHVLTPGSSLQPVKQEVLPLSQKNISKVCNALHETLADMEEWQRESLFAYLTDNCTVVHILTREFDNAFQIFLTINDRGTRLERGDILKTELMSQVGDDLRDQYREILESWNDSLGEPETARGGKKTFFNHFWYALTGNPTRMLDDIRKQVKLAGGAIPFIDNVLIQHAGAYRIIKKRSWPEAEYKEEIERILGHLAMLPHDEWMSTLMLAIIRHKQQPEHLLEIMRRIERLAYSLLIQPIGAQNRRKRYNAARRVLRGDTPELDVLKELQLKDSERRITRNSVEQALHRNHSSAAKLVLLRLDMQASGMPASYYTALMKDENYTVEHMLPRSPRKSTRWMVVFPDEKQREFYKERLGNLFLVRDKAENTAMKNYDFVTKHEILFKDKGDHPMALTNELQTLKDWGPTDIDDRQQRLMQMIDEIWGLG